jgi:glycosyltransferase involved in cell wall biosynthesis
MEQRPVLISIVIPAYKNSHFIKRLLNAIANQTFRNYEVVITDDSPGDELMPVIEDFKSLFTIVYKKNIPALGTPENWNEGIRLAKGEWIKLMHDDDWFAEETSLQEYADAIHLNPGAGFIFSAYTDVFLAKKHMKTVFLNLFRYKKFLKNPLTLLSKNIIGPPSVTLHRNNDVCFYDKEIKWLVDIDFYCRCLKQMRSLYIDKPLINVGISEEQVTRDCFGNRAIEIPENFYLMEKMGFGNLKNILIYDAWWRLMRKLKIRNKKDIESSGYIETIPSVVLSMISFQSKFPFSVLQIGAVSKLLMFMSYILSYRSAKN